jgi:hypothetical protein
MITNETSNLVVNSIGGAGFGLGGAFLHYLQIGGSIGGAISGIIGAIISMILLYRLLTNKRK